MAKDLKLLDQLYGDLCQAYTESLSPMSGTDRHSFDVISVEYRELLQGKRGNERSFVRSVVALAGWYRWANDVIITRWRASVGTSERRQPIFRDKWSYRETTNGHILVFGNDPSSMELLKEKLSGLSGISRMQIRHEGPVGMPICLVIYVLEALHYPILEGTNVQSSSGVVERQEQIGVILNKVKMHVYAENNGEHLHMKTNIDRLDLIDVTLGSLEGNSSSSAELSSAPQASRYDVIDLRRRAKLRSALRAVTRQISGGFARLAERTREMLRGVHITIALWLPWLIMAGLITGAVTM